jgi:cation diffusion facilitator family transporter
MADPDKKPPAVRAERVLVTGVVVNTCLAVLKILAGLVSGSPSLLADGYHSLGDLATNGLAWLSWRWARQPADEDHHYGHGKMEAMAALLVGGLLVLTGAGVWWHAARGESVSYMGSEIWIALAAALLSIVVNAWLTRLTLHVAQETDSPALNALAADNRSDVWTSVLVVIGVSSSAYGLSWVETVATVLIGFFVLMMGQQIMKTSFDTLTDRISDAGLRGRVTELASAVDGVCDVGTIAAHPLGGSLRVDMEISVNGSFTVRQGHAIAHAVEENIINFEKGVVEVAVHVNPIDDPEA